MNNILQTNTPVKKFKSHSPIMKCTEIMKKLHPKNKLMDSKTNKQRYHCVNLIQKEKKDNSRNLNTAQKMNFSIKDFFSKQDQIRSFLRLWSNLLKKFFMENFTFVQRKIRGGKPLGENLNLFFLKK